MVCIPLVKRLADAPAEHHDPSHIKERHGQHQQRRQNGEFARVFRRVKVRNAKDREQVSDKVASAVTKKRFGLREVKRQKPEQRAGRCKSEAGDQVLSFSCGDTAENNSSDRS